MSVRDELLEKRSKQIKKVYYKFPMKGLLGKRETMKFLIRPIVSADLITKEVTKEALKEMGTGQSIEEAARIAGENFKKKFISMGKDSAFKLLVEKGVEYPKIVEKEKDLKDDELPYKYLDMDMKNFIIQELMKISPIFQGA